MNKNLGEINSPPLENQDSRSPRRGGLGRGDATREHTKESPLPNPPHRRGGNQTRMSEEFRYALDKKSPDRVSTRTISPSLRYSGTWTMRPVSSVAGFVPTASSRNYPSTLIIHGPMIFPHSSYVIWCGSPESRKNSFGKPSDSHSSFCSAVVCHT